MIGSCKIVKPVPSRIFMMYNSYVWDVLAQLESFGRIHHGAELGDMLMISKVLL